MITPRRLAALYALYGMLAVLLLAIMMPPFENPDEPAHLVRADQISHGGWLARAAPGSPALIDWGLLEGAQRFSALTRDPQAHVGRELYAPLGWGGRVVAAFPSSAIYPPAFYLPAAAALAAARHNHLTVLPAIELARAATGMAAIAVGCLALALAGAWSVWLFAVLTLPMALAQTAAIGQDALMIACCALAAACLVRLQDCAQERRTLLFAVLCLCLALVCQARPPYAALALLPFAACVGLRLRVAGCVVILVAIAAWCGAALPASGADIGHFNGSDAHAQAIGLLAAPWRVPGLLYRTLATFGKVYAAQFIGVLGWLDVVLPQTYRRAACGILLLAALCCVAAGSGRWAWRRGMFCALCLAAAAGGVFMIQYLTWSAPNAAVINGVQGRYFLPLAALMPAVLARPASARISWPAWPVVLFPIATIAVTIHKITLRYYL